TDARVHVGIILRSALASRPDAHDRSVLAVADGFSARADFALSLLEALVRSRRVSAVIGPQFALNRHNLVSGSPDEQRPGDLRATTGGSRRSSIYRLQISHNDRVERPRRG